MPHSQIEANGRKKNGLQRWGCECIRPLARFISSHVQNEYASTSEWPFSLQKNQLKTFYFIDCTSGLITSTIITLFNSRSPAATTSLP